MNSGVDFSSERVGQYAFVRDLRIDKAKAGSAKVFRCEGWSRSLSCPSDGDAL